MWSKLTVADREKAQKYLDCYCYQNCRSSGLAALRSQIMRSGQSHFLYEGEGFALVLCLGVKNRSGRHTMFDVSYTPGVDVDVVVPLFLDKFREYSEEFSADEIDFALADNIRPEGIRMLLQLAQSSGVALTSRDARPGFTQFTLRFQTVPP